jgi:hypothetical protein
MRVAAFPNQEATMATCENAGCRGRFTPKRNWQKFCSSKCRAFSRNQVLKDRYTTPQAHTVLMAAMAWYAAAGAFEETEYLKQACARHWSAENPEEET